MTDELPGRRRCAAPAFRRKDTSAHDAAQGPGQAQQCDRQQCHDQRQLPREGPWTTAQKRPGRQQTDLVRSPQGQGPMPPQHQPDHGKQAQQESGNRAQSKPFQSSVASPQAAPSGLSIGVALPGGLAKPADGLRVAPRPPTSRQRQTPTAPRRRPSGLGLPPQFCRVGSRCRCCRGCRPGGQCMADGRRGDGGDGRGGRRQLEHLSRFHVSFPPCSRALRDLAVSIGNCQ